MGFIPRGEHAVGARDLMLGGILVRLFEVFIPEHPNSYCCALYHRNHSYAITEIIDNDNDEVSNSEN